MENMNVNENVTEEKPKENENCPLCDIVGIDVAIGVAHAACRASSQLDKKIECLNWIEGINPADIKSAEKIWEEAYDKAGLEGITIAAKAFWNSFKDVIIKKVHEMQERGEEVPQEMQELYKKVIKELTI